jgi:protein-S-isoprenylcysteine O-methyltransferase Ste14
MLPSLWTFLFYFWFAMEIVIAVATRTGKSRGKTSDRGSQLILWVVIVSAITACEWLRHIFPPNIPDNAHWLRPASVILLVTGLLIRCMAILTLGKAFSANVAIRDAQKINRAGLYGVIRHPSYLGMLIIFFAIGLHSRNWQCLAVALVPTTAALLYRIHVEEAALREAFGEEYVSYCQDIKRLIPGVF